MAAALGASGKGALVVGIPLLVLSLVALEDIEPPTKTASETSSETAAMLGPMLAAALVLGLARLARKKRRPLNDVVVLAAPTMVGIILCLLPSYPWWDAYQYDGTRLLAPVMVGAGLILIGLGRTLINAQRIYLDLHPQPPAFPADEEAPAIASAADDAKTEPSNPEPGTPEPTTVGAGRNTNTPSRTIILLRRWLPLLAAACVPAVTVALVIALVNQVIPSPDISFRVTGHQADAVSQDSLPAIPTVAPTQVAWTTTLMRTAYPMAMTAGTRGPIILTQEGIQALDSEDGSALWTYQVTGAAYQYPDIDAYYRAYTLVSSPDRRHVAVLLESVDERFDNARGFTTVVLDTATGEVTAEHRDVFDYEVTPDLQLTNSIALAGRDIFSLDGGSLLGRISSKEAEHNYTGTAGHSTLVLVDFDEEQITLHLIPEADLARRTALRGACQDQFLSLSSPSESDVPTIEAGWTALCTSGTEDPDAHVTSWTMTAVNIDEIAASGAQGDVDAGNVSAESQASLGAGLGLDHTASAAAGTLITRTEKDRTVRESTYGTTTDINPQAHMILDPATRTAFPADQSASIATADISFTGPPYGEPVSDYTLTITPSNGAPPVSAAFTSTQVFSSPDDPEYRKVVAAPGASVIALATSGSLNGPSEITIVGVR